ncbi:MAG: hypothetical protein AAF806_02410 [Bacteroidota bacterium]
MKQISLLLVFSILYLLVDGKDDPSIFQHFQRDSLLQMTLKTDLRQLVRKKSRESYQAAQLNYLDATGIEQMVQLKVRARGNARKSLCFYPPLKLKFAKADLEAMGFNTNFNKLKLVCPCKKGELHEQYLIREYLAYRLFNEVSPMSFRVQLVALNIVDTTEKMKPLKSYGFLIEPEQEVATRFDGIPHRTSVLNPKYTLPEQTNLIYLFQYMIGNTDWSITGQHNMFSFRTRRYTLPVCVPYDFDYSGIVNTTYAVLSEKLSISSVTERLFRGTCRAEGTYASVAQSFITRKAAFYQIIAACSPLTSKSSDWMCTYLDEFFKIIENPKLLQASVVGYCR